MLLKMCFIVMKENEITFWTTNNIKLKDHSNYEEMDELNLLNLIKT